MTYQEIKSFINTYIVQNGVNAITGSQLNTALNALADYYGFDSVTVTTLPAGSDATVNVQGRTLELGIPKGVDGADGRDGRDGLDATNPFKGWFNSLADLKASYTASVGDSAYVKDASPATTWSIYIYDSTASSDNYWGDSGIDADTSNVQTFESGEEVNQVSIIRGLADAADIDVLSAKYGNGIVDALLQIPKISTYVERTSTADGQIGGDGTVHAQNYCYVNVYNITNDMRESFMLIIKGYVRLANTNGYTYAFYDANDVFISGFHGTPGEENVRYFLPVEIPSNAATLKVARYYSSSTTHSAYLYTINTVKSEFNEREITPPLERGRLSSTGFPQESNSNGGGSNTFYINNKRTMNFVKIPYNRVFRFKCSIECYVRVYNYADDYSFIDYKEFQYVDTSSEYQYTATIGTRFVKMMWSMTSQTDYTTNVPDFSYYIKAAFVDGWNVKNIYPIGSYGYQHICPVVHPLDPNSCNQETNDVQDNPVRAYDDGILALPSSYTNEGNPTRLIIYCHGAGVNYSSSNSYFPSTDCRPAYWRAMGYAVMDVDGECGASADVQHNCAPESLQCYIEAYKLVVERYNIAKDGVFLGGRSMGGAMSMYIMQSGEIPVIANCPVVPVMNTLWWWNYCSADMREYLATKMGMQGTQPSWTSGRMTQSEWQYLQDNFDTLRKYSPLWSCIVDLPVDKSVLFNEAFRVSADTINVPEEVALFGTLHAKVKAPVKFFDNYEDPSVPYERNAMLMYKMLVNGGNIVECRMFDVSQDTDTSVTAHHFEMRYDRLVTVTTPSGQVIENVPVVYIEMLRFWQRYE